MGSERHLFPFLLWNFTFTILLWILWSLVSINLVSLSQSLILDCSRSRALDISLLWCVLEKRYEMHQPNFFFYVLFYMAAFVLRRKILTSCGRRSLAGVRFDKVLFETSFIIKYLLSCRQPSGLDGWESPRHLKIKLTWQPVFNLEAGYFGLKRLNRFRKMWNTAVHKSTN